MPTTSLHSQLRALLSESCRIAQDEPMSRHTTLRVGGPADCYVEPASEVDLTRLIRFCADHGVSWFLIGRGSNLLVRDGGIRGVVICLSQPAFAQLEVKSPLLICGAGTRLKTVAVEARRHGLSGLEFLEGIPGHMGGALRMNAGAMGSSLFDILRRIRIMDATGKIHEKEAADIPARYRCCPFLENHIALSAVLEGSPADPETISRRMTAYSEKRWDSQPAAPSAGCMFKNPPSMPAGRLVDELGLKGTSVGGAAVSEVHGNFIVNQGNATARDILGLIDLVRHRALAERGIALQTEVQILGEDTPEP